MRPEDRYWAVDLPGLTEEGAAAILAAAKRLDLVGPSALDPTTFLTIAMDRDTVIALATVLRRAPEPDDVVTGVLEAFDAWIAYSAPDVA
jgi:hypothetical protein